MLLPVAKVPDRPRLTVMNFTLHLAGHDVSAMGIVAFVAWFGAGLLAARILQSNAIRRFLRRFRIETNLIAIAMTVLSLVALIFFTVNAINAAGIPLSWSAGLPGIKLSLIQIFLLVALLIGGFLDFVPDQAFSFRSVSGQQRPRSFSPIRHLADHQQCRTHRRNFRCPGEHRNPPRGPDRFCRSSRSWRRFWITKHRQQLHQRPGHPGGETDHDWRPGRGCRHRRSSGTDSRSEHGHSDQ